MAATVLYRNDEMLDINDEVSASNRLSYSAYVSNFLVGSAQNHSNGELREETIKTISYDLVQNSPDDFDSMAKIIKPLSTEFAQANLMPKDKVYNRVVFGQELKLSTLKNITAANGKAKMLNNLDKLWDFIAYTGGDINVGISENSNKVDLSPLPMTTIHEVNAAVTAGIETMKSLIGISDNDENNISIGYTNGISPVLSTIFESGDIARKLLTDAHPDAKFGQIPIALSNGTDYIELSFRPAVELDHGAIPGFFGEEAGKYSTSKEYLAVFESAAVNIDEYGAVIRIPAASVPAKAKVARARK